MGIACYLVNWSPTSTLVDKIMHKAWNGKKTSIKHLKVFGCDAFVHVLKENRSKVDNKDENVSLLALKMV
jgi:hypothetical protein